MHLKILAATAVVGALTVAGSLTSPASAYYPPEDWVDFNTSRVDRDTVRMAPVNDLGEAYLYNSDLDFPVTSGDIVSFDIDTQDQTLCNGRLYVYLLVDGREFASYDDGTPCPGNTTVTLDDGPVSFTISETGRIGFTQVYFEDIYDDNLNSVVEISNLTVAGEPIYFNLDAGPPPPPGPTPVATAYGATLSKPRPCRVKTFAYHDAAGPDQVAYPRKRQFITRIDGRIRTDFTLTAGRTGRAKFDIRPDTGRRTVVVRLFNGELLDRITVRTRRC